MKRAISALCCVLLPLAAALLSSCGAIEGGCASDSDCKGSRICQFGSCVDPGANGQKTCGETVVACNCQTTSLMPGQITNNTLCQSRKGQASPCNGSCGGAGVPWTVRCYCAEDESCSEGIVKDPGCSCDTKPASQAGSLGVRFHAQHTQVWCWGAVSSSVTDYFRHVMGEDCQFLSAWWAKNGAPVDCCANPQACLRPGLSMGEIQAALLSVGGIHSRWVHAPISEAMLRQEIANGRPVIVGLTGFSGHVAVIAGATASGFNVQDPYAGEFMNVPYSNLLQNQIGNWTDTLYQMGTSARCTY